jgi:imidazolonepropionase
MVALSHTLRIRNARLFQPTGRGFEVMENACLLARDGAIIWVGETLDQAGVTEEIDAEGRLLTPGLIDCHTHLVYGGHRCHEFEKRLEGTSYTEISKQGGGIMSTVRATREATDDELLSSFLARLNQLRATGVTTVDVKSGYGLDFETERRMLRIASQAPIRVRRGFLGLHCVPPEMSSDEYVRVASRDWLGALIDEGLVDYVDAFCEKIAFSAAHCREFFAMATSFGIPVRIHADQLSNGGGATLAGEFNALSADHVEYTVEAAVEIMARGRTVAVLLPGAFYFLKETQNPPIEAFRRHGVPMAVATDANPGSSPLLSMPVAMNMACVLFGLSVAEVWAGATIYAARALGLPDLGRLEPGKPADWVLWDAEHPREVVAGIGTAPVYRVSPPTGTLESG